MTMLLLFFLIIVGIFLLISRCYKSAIVVYLFAVILMVVVGTGILPLFLLKNLESASMYSIIPNWKSKNAIIVLGGGISKTEDIPTVKPFIAAYSRIFNAAKLYAACKKENRVCTIIVSGGDPAKTGTSEAEIYKEELIKLNIDPKDILTETESLNTFQNAQFVKRILENKNFDQLFLVTSGIHLKRALLYFSHFKLYPIGLPSDLWSSSLSYLPKSYQFVVMDSTLHEILGIWRYRLYNFLGWNVSATKPGDL